MMKAFVIMPFDDPIANNLYDLSTKPVCKEFGLEVQRADEIFTTNPILDDIVTAIEEASVIIADISGKNPNVFYELGMSHMLKRKQTIMITHEEYKGVPFDISHFRIIKYENTISGKTNYETQLRRTLRNILRDYKSIYKREFEMTLDVFLATKRSSDLYQLMSLAKTPSPLKRDERLVVEGHNEQIGRFSSESYSVEGAVSTFINMGYAQVSANLVVLTDKGKAFVGLLEEKGFVLDFVNGHILTEGYVPFGTMAKKSRRKTKK